MTAAHVGGVLLVALPFAAVLGVSVVELGWLETLAAVAVVAAAVGLIALGLVLVHS